MENEIKNIDTYFDGSIIVFIKYEEKKIQKGAVIILYNLKKNKIAKIAMISNIMVLLGKQVIKLMME